MAQFQPDIGVDIKFLIFLYSSFVKFHTNILKYFQTNKNILLESIINSVNYLMNPIRPLKGQLIRYQVITLINLMF